MPSKPQTILMNNDGVGDLFWASSLDGISSPDLGVVLAVWNTTTKDQRCLIVLDGMLVNVNDPVFRLELL